MLFKKLFYYLVFGFASIVASAQSAQNIFVATIPKSGTHLISKSLELLLKRNVIRIENPQKVIDSTVPLQRNNELFRSHLPYHPKAEAFFKKNNYKCLLMMRDPRDQLVSMSFWFVMRPNKHADKAARYAKDPSYLKELMMNRIRHIADYYKKYLPWQKNSRFHTVKFENLVGYEGGGTRKKQINEIKRMGRHLGIALTDETIGHCVKNLFGGTYTFRKGQIGGWKKYFTEEHKRVFKQVAGQLLIDLGYEKDFNW